MLEYNERMWWILGFALGCGPLSVGHALLPTQWYLAEVVLTPTGATSEEGLAAQIGVGLLTVIAGQQGVVSLANLLVARNAPMSAPLRAVLRW